MIIQYNIRIILILCCYVLVLFAQEIEYYPSQAVINHNKLVIKQSSHFKTNNKITNYEDKNTISIINTDCIRVSNGTRIYNTKQSNCNSRFLKRKRFVDPVFHGHPKTKEELWNEHFINESIAFDQTPSLISLINNITLTYLLDCTPIILYDSYVDFTEVDLLQKLFEMFPVTYVNGRINDQDEVDEPKILKPKQNCLHYIVLITDVQRFANIIKLQAVSKMVVIARSSSWAVQEFLAGPLSRKFTNLLVIGQSFKDENNELEAPYILYTHKLYIDGLGASKPIVLSSWSRGKFSRNVNLFPSKLRQGYAGHRFIISAAHQPPFVFRRIQSDADGGNPRVVWDGIEIRILRLLAARNNFSIEIIEPRELNLGPGDAVSKEINMARADIGIAGIYITEERIKKMDMSFSHSEDCAVFITLMSTALPRYRAILGPFHWHVWLALTITYLVGIFPLAFSDKHTLRHLIHNGGEIENMFWYVFGTFTNCFTFVGKNSWSKTKKVTTRLLIGWYWIFTIIITSCYTGSIIAFVTLPVFPSTVDSIDQLLKGFYRIGTLDHGGWQKWFLNSSDTQTNKLFSKIQLVPDVLSGIRNTTKAFFFPYAFLGSRAELEYIVQANFSTTKSKRAVLHVSNECFVPFGVAMVFPNQSLYTSKLSNDIRRMSQSGLLQKISNEVRWEMQRSSTGKLLSVAPGTIKIISAEEKGLTLEDTQGMFLLLGAGFLIAAGALLSEWMGGCSRRCPIRKIKDDEPSIESNRGTLIASRNTEINSETKLITDDDSSVKFGNRNSSAESRDTLDGEIIHVNEDNIVVHNTLDVNDWDSRRSSSTDVDKEIQAIFERDHHRKRIHSISITDICEDSEGGTVSNGGKVDGHCT